MVIIRQKSYWLLAKVISAYIGAVIGAGFASGQEIMQFFILHGRSGLIGAALATILFAYLGGLVMYLAITMRSGSYKKLLGFLLGEKAGRFMDIFNLFMLLGGVGVMMAGSAAVFSEQFDLPAGAGIWSVAVLTSLVLMGGLEGVLNANVCLVPLKYLAVLAISLAALLSPGGLSGFHAGAAASGGVAGSWALAGFLYVSYNMVVPVAVLSSLGNTVPLKTGLAGGVLGGLLLGLAVFLVTAAGLAHMPEAASYQVPMLYLAGSFGPVLRLGLGLLIWLAILTTTIANAHGFASRLAPAGGVSYRLYGIGSCLLALPLASFSFSSLVRFLYPLFGYAGLVLLVALLARPLLCFCRNR
ncbi:hypothetical protein ACOBQJ_12305 [Pelotomaculum propionicicum]|uniref:YkvI family membrane protein n=1 Tax=Pelotomaculum propionicicum TaxID=258475 RepID=UPI003B7CF39F